MLSLMQVTAVIVLHERRCEESEALHSLEKILVADRSAALCIRVLLYDNSTQQQACPVSAAAAIEYVHDAVNGGLAAAYTYGLKRAQAARSEWLLLLDQDTTLTPAYVTEMLAAIDEAKADDTIAAFVPILEMDGTIYSPERDFFYHLRHQFPWAKNYPLPRNSAGVQSYPLNAYNSGVALRVRTLHEMGGFPAGFRVDYLDHSVFRVLQQGGYSVAVLPCILQQKLSHNDLNQVSLARHRSVMHAQCLFVSRYGTLLDRLLFRIWLLRKARHYRLLTKDNRVWKGMVLQALGPWQRPRKEHGQ